MRGETHDDYKRGRRGLRMLGKPYDTDLLSSTYKDYPDESVYTVQRNRDMANAIPKGRAAVLALKEQEFTANGEEFVSYSDGKFGFCMRMAEFKKLSQTARNKLLGKGVKNGFFS